MKHEIILFIIPWIGIMFTSGLLYMIIRLAVKHGIQDIQDELKKQGDKEEEEG